LNFLHQIGFDAIPQEVTDTIIANINASSNTYWLHKSISPENGSLGFDSDLWNKNISNGEKQKFIELYNKMLTWSREHPVKLINWEIIFYDNLENARAGISTGFTFDIWEFANRSLWSEPVVRAMMNLEKGEDKEEK
jgi:hypothetical protein